MKNLDLSEYKKLFSLVLGVNIKDIYKLGSNPNLKVTEMPYSINGCGELETINIFELSNMCNIWVKNNGYRIETGLAISGKEWWGHIYNGSSSQIIVFNCFKESEPEATFRCAQHSLIM